MDIFPFYDDALGVAASLRHIRVYRVGGAGIVPKISWMLVDRMLNIVYSMQVSEPGAEP